MRKNWFATLVSLIGTGWVIHKILGDPSELGVVGYSLWVIAGMIVFMLIFVLFQSDEK